MSDPGAMAPGARSAARLLPCPSCGYNLRGRRVGELCPECGWTIDAPGPRWWTPECLRRLRKLPQVAIVATLVLLAVPMLTLLALLGQARPSDVVMAATIAFCIVASLQALVQGIVVWRMAMPELGAQRVRRLRRAAATRAAATVAGCVAIWLAMRLGGSPARQDVWITLYFTLPLVAIAADFTVTRELGALHRESGVLLSGWMAVLPLIGRWMLVPISIVCLLPVVGWFVGLCAWATVLWLCFAQVEAVAEASRRELAEQGTEAGNGAVA